MQPGKPNVGGCAHGIIHIPDDLDIPPLVDLWVVEPGKAVENMARGGTGSYIPPVFLPGMSLMRVAPELMHPGRQGGQPRENGIGRRLPADTVLEGMVCVWE